MNHLLRILAIGAVLASGLQAGADEPQGASADGSFDALRTFDEIHGRLEAGLEAKMSCDLFSTYAASAKGCQFADFCKYLAKNADHPYLYENADGERLPNYALYGVEKTLEACFNHKASELAMKSQPAGDAGLEAMKQHRQRTMQAEKDFLESVRKHHEEATWEKLQEAAVDLSLAWDGSAKTIPALKTKEDVEKSLVAAEQAAGSRFSDSTRALWIESVWEASPFYRPAQDTAMVPPTLPKWDKVMTDPFIDPSRLWDEKAAGGPDQLAKNQELAKTQALRVQKIYSDVQDRIVRFLKSKFTQANASQLNSLVARVRNTVYKPHFSQDGVCASPNAFFDPSDMTFQVCPQMMELPTRTLEAIIGHELSHAIDPCDAAAPLFQATGDVAKKRIAAKNAGSKPQAGHLDVDLGQPARDGVYFQDVREMSEGVDLEQIGAPVPLSKNPFASVLQCLKSKASVHAPAPSKQDVAAELDEGIRKLRDAGYEETGRDLKGMVNARKNLDSYFDRFGACSGFVKAERSQLQESFADWVSYEVLGKEIGQLDEKQRKDAVLEGAGANLLYGCSGFVSDKLAQLEADALKKSGCAVPGSAGSVRGSIAKAYAINGTDHAWDADRVNRIMLEQPDLAAALGCKPQKGLKHCE